MSDVELTAESSKPADAVDRYFSGRAATYHEASSRGLWRWYRTMETGAVMDLLESRPGEAILDAGCGAGHYSEVLVRAGASVTSLDTSEAMLESLRSRLAVETIQADLATVTLAPTFDRVVCLGVLEFVDDPVRVLDNLRLGLRPGGPGRIVVLVPRRSWRGRIYRAFHRRHGVAVRLLGREDLDGLAEEAGMRVDGVRAVTHNWVARMRTSG